jgi:hypothetical protein
VARFEHNTYIVLDIPSTTWVQEVISLREKYNPERANLPVEITIIGSSGIGVFDEEQDEDEAIIVSFQYSGGSLCWMPRCTQI